MAHAPHSSRTALGAHHMPAMLSQICFVILVGWTAACAAMFMPGAAAAADGAALVGVPRAAPTRMLQAAAVHRNGSAPVHSNGSMHLKWSAAVPLSGLQCAALNSAVPKAVAKGLHATVRAADGVYGPVRVDFVLCIQLSEGAAGAKPVAELWFNIRHWQAADSDLSAMQQIFYDGLGVDDGGDDPTVFDALPKVQAEFKTKGVVAGAPIAKLLYAADGLLACAAGAPRALLGRRRGHHPFPPA